MEEKIRKGEIKYKISLDEHQKQAKELIINNPIVAITGRSGSGKSLVCAQAALDFLFKKEFGIEKIYICKALVEMENDTMGFLKGSILEKVSPYLESFIDNLEKCYDKEKISKLLSDGKIEYCPPNFLRGRTIDNAVLIIEEGQNMSKFKMLSLLERIGKNGKIIVNGDVSQRDVEYKDNGMQYCKLLSENIEGFKYVKLQGKHRHDIVGLIHDFEYGK